MNQKPKATMSKRKSVDAPSAENGKFKTKPGGTNGKSMSMLVKIGKALSGRKHASQRTSVHKKPGERDDEEKKGTERENDAKKQGDTEAGTLTKPSKQKKKDASLVLPAATKKLSGRKHATSPSKATSPKKITSPKKGPSPIPSKQEVKEKEKVVKKEEVKKEEAKKEEVKLEEPKKVETPPPPPAEPETPKPAAPGADPKAEDNGAYADQKPTITPPTTTPPNKCVVSVPVTNDTTATMAEPQAPPPPAIMGDPQPPKPTESEEPPLDLLPTDREKNIDERKDGFEYLIVSVPMKPGLKFGLGVKSIYRTIYVQKIEENSIVGGLFNVADRIIDVDGLKVQDNGTCKTLLVKGLKEKGIATVVVERAVTDVAKKIALDELNEEHNTSIMVAPDVRDIMRKMEMKIRSKPAQSALKGNAPLKPVDFAPEKRKSTVLEEGHQSVMIQMDNEDKLSKLQKVVKGSGK